MEKKITKYVLGILMISLLLFASGCSAKITSVNQNAKSDDEIADRYLEMIVETIENTDADSLTSMFSKDVLSQADSKLFSQSVDELFSVWQGNMIRFDGELSTSKEMKDEKTIHKIIGFYDVETTENTCHLLFMSTIQDEGNKNAEGISMIVYVSDELYQSEGFYWEYGNREPGIYIDEEVSGE